MADTYEKGDKYHVYKTLVGYYTSEEAKKQKAINQSGKVYKGTYYIYNTSKGMVNVTKVKGVPGSWINPTVNIFNVTSKITRKKSKKVTKLNVETNKTVESLFDIPRSTALRLIYGGAKVTWLLKADDGEDTQYHPERFVYTDYACDTADTIDITYSDAYHNWITTFIPKEGDYLQASIYVKNWEKKGDTRKLPCGKFMIDDFYFDGPPDKHIMSAISCPINTSFSSTKKNKTWKNITIKSIATSMASTAGATLYYESDNYTIEEIEQSDISDMNFLYSVCKDYNLAMKLYNDKIVIFDEVKYEKKETVGTIKKEQCSSWNLQSTLVGIYNGVTIAYTDSKNSTTLKYSFMATDGNRILKINEKAESYKEAEIKAKSKLRETNKNAVRVSIGMKGDVNYIAGTCYNVEGFGKFDGKYYLEQVRHSIANGYTVDLELHKVLEIEIGKSKEEESLEIDALYQVNTTLIGYKTAAEAKALNASSSTGKVYKGKYYIYNTGVETVNVTKVKMIPGSWVNTGKNEEG
ncbi:MAG: phage late control D family protein [Velocimicrobium sp.]